MSFTVCDIVGVPINNINMNEAISLVLLYINEEKNDSPKIIFTPNPEFVIHSLEDDYFLQILNQSDLNIADGIGIVIASKILGYSLKGRVAGYDLVQNIFQKIKNTEKTVYFLGATEDVIEKAKIEMEKKFRGLSVIGFHSGYFSKNKESLIIDEINNLAPDLLLVGLGCPKQEKWIFENRHRLNTKVMIGVGGSFDVMSGFTKRAPDFFIKLNLEWFYRLITQPTRFKRMLKLPQFLLKVIKYKFKGGKNEKI